MLKANKAEKPESLLQANKPEKPAKVEYSTDKEELAKYTECITVINKKRKIYISRPPQQYAQAHQSPVRENQDKAVVNKFKKAKQPPPVILETVKNYNELYDILKDNLKDEPYNMNLIGKDTIKINW